MIAALMSSVRTPASPGFSALMRSTSTPSARLAAARSDTVRLRTK